MRPGRRGVWLVVLGTAATGLGLFAPTAPATALCQAQGWTITGPGVRAEGSIEVPPAQPPQLPAGARVRVTMNLFVCHDAGGPGCSSPGSDPGYGDQPLRLVEPGRIRALGTTAPDDTVYTWDVTVPPDVDGPATLRVGDLDAAIPVLVVPRSAS